MPRIGCFQNPHTPSRRSPAPGPAAAGYWARMKVRAQQQMVQIRDKATEQRGAEWRSAAENVAAVKVAAQVGAGVRS
jgi:hypothetical protein